jgi:hypothetical protein
MAARPSASAARLRRTPWLSAGVWALAAWAATVVPAGAELVHFSTGRVLSVRSVFIDPDGQALLLLRSGGTVACHVSLIARVTSDEVAHLDVAAMPEAPLDAERLASLLAPARPFAALVQAAARTHDVDADLVHAVIAAESSYAPDARSPKGALGLMQLMPATARQYAVKDPLDPAENVDAGVRHLKRLLDRFELSLALAAYNAGVGAVQRFGGVPPFAETRRYVQRVLQVLAVSKGGRTGAP